MKMVTYKKINLDGMISRIVQHEYDHILGKNFDRLRI